MTLMEVLDYIHLSKITFLGWLSVTLLTVYAIPLAGKVVREKSAESVDNIFLWMWFIGELTGLLYVIFMNHWLMALNYLVNVMALSIIIYYKITSPFYSKFPEWPYDEESKPKETVKNAK